VIFGVSLLIAFRQERRTGARATSDAERLLTDEGESR
jgi:hypothetical protein